MRPARRRWRARQRSSQARLEWALDDDPLLAELVDRGLRLGEKNGHCPFLVSHKAEQRRLGAGKTHVHQVLPNRLTQLFTEARTAAKVTGEHPPSFHEIRSLGSKLYADEGHQITDIQELMAHSDEDMTLLYQTGHELPWKRVPIKLTNIGREW